MTTPAVFDFNFRDQPFRVIERFDEPWFVAADALSALDLDRKALERLDDDEKGVNSIHTPGGAQEMTVINEPGLYSLILGSRKPEAKPFKRWVTHEVLPAIRKHGFYSSYAYTVRPNGAYHPEAALTPEEKKHLLELRPDWKEIFDMAMRGLNGSEIADKLGQARTTVYNKLSRLRRCGILPPPARQAALAIEQKLIASGQTGA